MDELLLPVRFNEADPLGIVWHGHYVRYFEDGRESFGRRYGFSYIDFYNNGLAVPIVSMQCDFKKPLRYGNVMKVVTTYEPVAAAKIVFRYKVFENETGDLVATGSSTQVFVDLKTFALHLIAPGFFEQWKMKWCVR